MYKFGAIVLVPFPFTDLSSSKLRPALIVSKTQEQEADVIVAFIASKIPKTLTRGQFVLSHQLDSFLKTGLKTDSMVLFDKLATLDKRLIVGELGQVEEALLKEMRDSFEEVFGFYS